MVHYSKERGTLVTDKSMRTMKADGAYFVTIVKTGIPTFVSGKAVVKFLRYVETC